MKKIYLTLFLLTGIFPIFKNLFAQSDSAVMSNFNYLKQVNYKQDSIAKAMSAGDVEASKFDRWEQFWSPRIGPSGDYAPMVLATNEYYKNRFSADRSASGTLTNNCSFNSSDWKPIGPTNFPTGNSSRGLGRMECIAFHPSNPRIMYAGACRGGVWKSTDAGNNWVNLNTDNLPVLGITDIVINPLNPNTIYISTGAHRGTGNNYSHSVGIYKSFNGGLTWFKTGMAAESSTILYCSNADQNIFDLRMGSYGTLIDRLIIHPTDTNTLLAAAFYFTEGNCNDKNKWGGIFKSSDGGVNWSCKKEGFMNDLEIKPNNSSVIYASGKEIYKSTDIGETWTVIQGYNVFVNDDCYPYCDVNAVGFWDNQASRIVIAVSPAAPDNLYILGNKSKKGVNGAITGLEYKEFWIYNNSNSTMTKKYSATISAIGNDHINLAVSPLEGNLIYEGRINFSYSTDWGTTFSSLNPADGFHVDVNDIQVVPGSATSCYVAHDGGISINTNKGISTAWLHRSNGLEVGQFHGFGASSDNSGILAGGLQDVTEMMYDGQGNWKQIYGSGDGGESIVDNSTNPATIYTSVWCCQPMTDIERSTDNGVSFTEVTPSNLGSHGGVFRYKLHPTNPSTIYAGFKNIGKSTQKGNPGTWINPPLSNFANFNIAQSITTFAIAPSNDKYIYVVFPGTRVDGLMTKMLYKTTNADATTPTWAEVPLPDNNIWHSITSIDIDPLNPNKIWVAYSGYDYQNNRKVYMSNNGGTSWINHTGTGITGLPAMPANTLKIDPTSSNESVYVGTDVGVYYRNNTMPVGEWVPFLTKLPNLVVNELEINPFTREIFASANGRGIWHSKMAVNIDAVSVNVSTSQGWTPTGNPIKNGVNRIYIQNSLTVTAGNLEINDLDVQLAANAIVTVKTGAKLTLNNSSLKGIGDCGNSWMLNIEPGGIFELKFGSTVYMDPGSQLNDYGQMNIYSSCSLEIGESAYARVYNGGQLHLENNSELLIHKGVTFLFDQGSNFYFKNSTQGKGIYFDPSPTAFSESHLDFSGNLIVYPNAIFTFRGDGFIDWKNGTTTTFGSNSKFQFSGSGKTDLIMKIGSGLSLNIPANIDIKDGKIEYGNNSMLSASVGTAFIKNLNFAGNPGSTAFYGNGNTGLNFQYSDFSNFSKGIFYENAPNGGIFMVGSTFSNCSTAVKGNNIDHAQINITTIQNTFAADFNDLQGTNICGYDFNSVRAVTVNGSQVTNCDQAAKLSDVRGFYMAAGKFKNCFTGILGNNSQVFMRTGATIENYGWYGIEMYGDAPTAMNQAYKAMLTMGDVGCGVIMNTYNSGNGTAIFGENILLNIDAVQHAINRGTPNDVRPNNFYSNLVNLDVCYNSTETYLVPDEILARGNFWRKTGSPNNFQGGAAFYQMFNVKKTCGDNIKIPVDASCHSTCLFSQIINSCLNCSANSICQQGNGGGTPGNGGGGQMKPPGGIPQECPAGIKIGDVPGKTIEQAYKDANLEFMVVDEITTRANFKEISDLKLAKNNSGEVIVCDLLNDPNCNGGNNGGNNGGIPKEKISNPCAQLVMVSKALYEGFGQMQARKANNQENPSEIILEQLNPSEINNTTNEISIFPNPNDGTMTVDYNLDQNENGKFIIYDLTGRKISEHILLSENKRLLLTETKLATGIFYYCVIVNGNREKVGKLTIIK